VRRERRRHVGRERRDVVEIQSRQPPVAAAAGKPWGWLIGSLIALFLSLGANAYLGLLLQTMRQRSLRDIDEGYVKV